MELSLTVDTVYEPEFVGWTRERKNYIMSNTIKSISLLVSTLYNVIRPFGGLKNCN